MTQNTNKTQKQEAKFAKAMQEALIYRLEQLSPNSSFKDLEKILKGQATGRDAGDFGDYVNLVETVFEPYNDAIVETVKHEGSAAEVGLTISKAVFADMLSGMEVGHGSVWNDQINLRALTKVLELLDRIHYIDKD